MVFGGEAAKYSLQKEHQELAGSVPNFGKDQYFVALIFGKTLKKTAKPGKRPESYIACICVFA